MSLAKLKKLKAQRDELDASIKQIEINFAVLDDSGSPRYLDGVEVQYAVCRKDETIAYFFEKEHAVMFLDAFNTSIDKTTVDGLSHTEI